MDIIDPRKIKQADLPLWVLSDDMRGFFSWGIKAHSQGNYSHIMSMVRPRYFATQSWTYRKVPIERYMKNYYRLKFWKPDLNPELKKILMQTVMRELNQPWWKRRYDFLGILGQALKIPWLNNPWRDYCSEKEAEHLRLVGMDIFRHPSPSQINSYFKTIPQMSVLGYWQED